MRCKSFVAALSLLLASCGPGVIAKPPSADAEINGGAATEKCKLAKDPLNPLIVEWPATNKVGLDSESRRGVVIVKFDGCSSLKVLTQCEAKGNYEAETVQPARDKMEIKNKDDLFALLPLGAMSLGGEVESGTSFVIDYVAVGQREYKGSAPEPTGICDGATHYVRRITIGAYSLDAQANGDAKGGAHVSKIGVGGSHEESDKRHRASGDPGKCESEPTSPSCNAPIQLELTPLPSRATPSSG